MLQQWPVPQHRTSDFDCKSLANSGRNRSQPYPVWRPTPGPVTNLRYPESSVAEPLETATQ